MKSFWNTYQAWRAQRRQKHLEWWERKRVKGKVRFVIQVALFWAGSMIVVTSIADFYFEGSVDSPKLFSRAIYFLIAGFVLGFVGWWSNEGRYKNAKIEARINSIEKQ